MSKLFYLNNVCSTLSEFLWNYPATENVHTWLPMRKVMKERRSLHSPLGREGCFRDMAHRGIGWEPRITHCVWALGSAGPYLQNEVIHPESQTFKECGSNRHQLLFVPGKIYQWENAMREVAVRIPRPQAPGRLQTSIALSPHLSLTCRNTLCMGLDHQSQVSFLLHPQSVIHGLGTHRPGILSMWMCSFSVSCTEVKKYIPTSCMLPIKRRSLT